MASLDLNKIVSNPFRTLGLPATASQAQVFAAARQMRIWENSADIPPTDFDLPPLGPVNRTRPQIESAVTQLAEPESRLSHRLLWFAVPPGASQPPAQTPESHSHTYAKAHDRALAKLAKLWISDRAMNRQDDWQATLAQFCQACSSAQYIAWLNHIEKKGQFDKRARGNEVQELIGSLSQSLADPILRQARSAVERGEVDEALARIKALESLGLPEAELAQQRRQLFDLVEDRVVSRCQTLIEEIGKEIRWGSGGGYILMLKHRRICNQRRQEYNTTIQPLLAALDLDPDNRDDRLDRISPHLVLLLRQLGNANIRAGRPRVAKKLYQYAKLYATTAAQLQAAEQSLQKVRKVPSFRAPSSGFRWAAISLSVTASLINGARSCSSDSPPSNNTNPYDNVRLHTPPVVTLGSPASNPDQNAPAVSPTPVFPKMPEQPSLPKHSALPDLKDHKPAVDDQLRILQQIIGGNEGQAVPSQPLQNQSAPGNHHD